MLVRLSSETTATKFDHNNIISNEVYHGSTLLLRSLSRKAHGNARNRNEAKVRGLA